MNVILHTVNTVPTAITSGDCDGGMGPSQPKREAKINMSCFHC